MRLGRVILLLCAVLVASAFVSVDVSSAIGGLPACSDFVDNDGDGYVDYPADPQCSSVLDTSEGTGGASECGPLPCVTFFTQYDPDGPSGSAPMITCQHGIAAIPGTAIDSIVAQSIDVTDTGCHGTPDVSVAVRVPLNLDTNRPTIKINKLGGAPGTLPLRIEAVQVDGDDASKRQTIGYDTLDSTAPSSFKAALNLNEQDNNNATRDYRVDLDITGPGARLAVVNDTFTPGTSLSDRKQLFSNRLTFRQSGSGTAVPTSASIVANLSDPHQHFHVEHPAAQATALDVSLRQPNDNPKVTASLDRVPATVDVDTFGGSHFVYDASAPTATASLHAENVQGQGNDAHRFAASIGISDLPAHAEYLFEKGMKPLVFSPRKVKPDLGSLVIGANGLKGGESRVTYKGSARTGAARVVLTDSRVPFFAKAKYLDVSLTDIPKLVKFTSGNDALHYEANNGVLGLLTFSALPKIPRYIVNLCGSFIECEDGVSSVDTTTGWSLGGRIHNLRTADLALGAKTDTTIDTVPDMIPPPQGCGPIILKRKAAADDCPLVPRYRPVNIDLTYTRNKSQPNLGNTHLKGHLNAMFPNTNFKLIRDSSGTLIHFGDQGTGNGSGPFLTIDGTNMAGLPKGSAGKAAKDMHLKLDNMPRSLTFTTAKDGFPLEVSASGADDNILDKAEIQMTSGPDDRLPTEECVGNQCQDYRRYDGLLYRDQADRFEIFARSHGLKRLWVHKLNLGNGDFLAARLRSNAFHDNDLALKIDMKKDLAIGTGNRRTESVNALLNSLPDFVDFDQSHRNDGITILDYDASRATDQLEYHDYVDYPGSTYRDDSTSASMNPVPAHVDICRVDSNDLCSEGTFYSSDKEADSGSLALHGSQRFNFQYGAFPCACSRFTQVDITAKDFEMQADGPKDDNDGTDGYLGFDTGWNQAANSTPPADAKVKAYLKTVAGSNNINEFRLGYDNNPSNGFAADRGIMHWNGARRLYFGFVQNSHPRQCGNGTSMFVLRPADSIPQFVVEGNNVEFNLEDDYC